MGAGSSTRHIGLCDGRCSTGCTDRFESDGREWSESRNLKELTSLAAELAIVSGQRSKLESYLNDLEVQIKDTYDEIRSAEQQLAAAIAANELITS